MSAGYDGSFMFAGEAVIIEIREGAPIWLRKLCLTFWDGVTPQRK